MTPAFYELVDQALALLRERGRLSYRALKRQFALDDGGLEDLAFELIEVQRVAADRDGAILVWTGPAETVPGPVDAQGAGPGGVAPQTAPAESPAPSAPSATAPASVDPPRVDPLSRAAPEAAEAERRQLSVMFCDLVGSTALAEALDPEELREVLGDYQSVCAGLIEGFGGVIARQVGDGLLVNFGYPQAHEDDAARAVRAGLAIVGALPELNGRLGRRFPALERHPLQVRIGLHTGLVVIGALGDSTYRDPMAVVGETPNIAARLQGLAAPDTVIVSGATHRLLGGAFVCEDLGRQALKGMAVPVAVHRVVREGEGWEAATAGSAGRLTPLLGREREFGMLLERWEQSQEGLGQWVLLSGEAGIGKSRLVRELKGRVGEQSGIVLEGRGSPYHQQSAFHPWIDLLERALRFDRGDAPEARLEKLTGALLQQRLPVQAMLPVCATLLGLPAPAAPDGTLLLTPQRQRQQTLEALQGLVVGLAAQQPVLMIMEDVHWADPSTLEALELLVQQAQTARLLLVLTARPEFHVSWASRGQLTELTLTRLRRAQVEGLVAALSEGRALPAEVVEQVARKTDGVPLFVEELTKMVLESGLVREGVAGGYELAGPLPPLAIPATLQDSLMARLDRLATTKVVAQVGATLGRNFSYELLQAVTGLEDAPLTLELSKLVEAELLYQRGLPPDATYSFKHALIQDAAYQMLLKSTRQQYHQRVAQVLETRFVDTVQTQPEVLGHHYTEAGLSAQAVGYWRRAGQRALDASANLEAIAHLEKGIQVLAMLPDTLEWGEQELDLQIALAKALVISKGYGAPGAKVAYERARDLAQRGGNPARAVPALYGLWRTAFSGSQFQTSRALGEQLLELAERAGEPVFLLAAHYALGLTLTHLGEWTDARRHLQAGCDLYDPEALQRHPSLFGPDPGVVCLANLATPLWHLGYPQQALAASQDALALARTLSSHFTLAVALYSRSRLHQLRREVLATQRLAEETITLSTERGFPHCLAIGMILRGWAVAGREPGAQAIAQIEQGIEGIGITSSRPYWLSLLADAHRRLGEPRTGLAAVAEALKRVEQSEECGHEPELYRLQGELLVDANDDGPHPDLTPEDCFRRSLEIARRHRARSLELRAALSLARLWQSRGDGAAAATLLAPIYDAFTEGFDTADLQEAKQLLEELAPGTVR
jgi:class 3 adenylate cyclase/tetratricopeptide (TPR) repeat protein